MRVDERKAAKVGRPRTYDPEVVLDTALRHFWRDGYAGARLDGICRDAGISKPSLYAAFGDKDDLYRAALERYADTYTERVVRALNGATTPSEVFHAYLTEIVAVLCDSSLPDGCLRVSTALECAETAPMLADMAKTQRRKTRKQIEAALKRTHASDPVALSYLAVTLSDGLGASARAGDAKKRLAASAKLAAASIAQIAGQM